MPARNADLHGLAPDTCPVALLLVDVVSDYDFPDGDRLLEQARPAVERMIGLVRRAREAGVPVVYANDNFGRWQDDFGAVVRRALRPESPARDLTERIRPGPEDYVVLKPKHSAFFQTPLETVLAHLGTRTLVLAGFTGDVCLLATALDANMRDFRLVVPADTVASMEPADNEAALAYLRRVADAETPPAADVDFAALIAEPADAAS
ncbi:MAG TPA: isochorismatase family cysteine hydrolase [Rubricoccaceae bacterium]